MILSEQFAHIFIISLEIAKIIGKGGEWDSTTYNRSKMLFCEMLKVVFEYEFSVKVNALTYYVYFLHNL